jgi:hypothetical protein
MAAAEWRDRVNVFLLQTNSRSASTTAQTTSREQNKNPEDNYTACARHTTRTRNATGCSKSRLGHSTVLDTRLEGALPLGVAEGPAAIHQPTHRSRGVQAEDQVALARIHRNDEEPLRVVETRPCWGLVRCEMCARPWARDYHACLNIDLVARASRGPSPTSPLPMAWKREPRIAVFMTHY